jgi:hypothetical protein
MFVKFFFIFETRGFKFDKIIVSVKVSLTQKYDYYATGSSTKII